MRTYREIPDKFYPQDFDAAKLRSVIEGSLLAGRDIEISAWSEEYAREGEGINWRIHSEQIPFREVRGRTEKGSIEDVFKDFSRYEKNHCTAPTIKGLPKTDAQWEEFANNFRYVFLNGLEAGVSVEFRAHIPGSNRRDFARFADLDFELAREDTLYYFGWDENSGSSEKEWLKAGSTHLLRAMSFAADKVEPAWQAMEEEDNRLAAIAERRRKIMLERQAQHEAKEKAKTTK